MSGEPTPASLTKLIKALKLDPERDVYRTPLLNIADLLPSLPKEERRDLRDEPFVPAVLPPLREADDLFAVIREQDVLLHHPYDSFDPVVELIARAAGTRRPRHQADALPRRRRLPIVKALARAPGKGKQVTAIVEKLKARFDESRTSNGRAPSSRPACTRRVRPDGPEDAAKCLLIVRRELQAGRSVHLSRGAK